MLNNVPLFESLPDNELAAIESHAVQKSYRKNTVIIEQGEEANAMYVLIEGAAKTYLADENGREIVLNELEPGAVIGELALLGDTLRTASVVTTQDSTFLMLTKHSFLQFLSDYPEVALNLIHLLVRRIQDLTESMGDLALCDVYTRMRKLLTDSAKDIDGRLIAGPFTHRQIADRVGSSREMISKIFKDLKVGGYIESEDHKLVLLKKLPLKW